MVRKYKECGIKYNTIYNDDNKYFRNKFNIATSKNDLPCYISFRSFVDNKLFVEWYSNSKRYRDNDLSSYIKISVDHVWFDFTKYNGYYKYNGCAKYEILYTNTTKTHYYTKGICFKLLAKELNND